MLFTPPIWSCSHYANKSKSEDKNRQPDSREQGGAVSKYIESFVRNSIKAGQRIGEGGGTPDGRTELIDIS